MICSTVWYCVVLYPKSFTSTFVSDELQSGRCSQIQLDQARGFQTKQAFIYQFPIYIDPSSLLYRCSTVFKHLDSGKALYYTSSLNQADMTLLPSRDQLLDTTYADRTTQLTPEPSPIPSRALLDTGDSFNIPTVDVVRYQGRVGLLTTSLGCSL